MAYESDVTLRARLVPRAARDAPLLGSGVTAVLTGVLLWGLWRWAGYPLGVFSPGLDGHGPDPYAWPRLLVLWVPLGHVLIALAFFVLGRWDSRGTLRRFRLADQLCLGLVLVLGAGLLLAVPDGRLLRTVVSLGYVDTEAFAQRSRPAQPRKALGEIVHQERW